MRTQSTGPSGQAPADGQPSARQGRLRRALFRMTAPDDEREAQDLQENTSQVGATLVSECQMKGQVCVAGSVRAVVVRPRAGVPTLEVELYDGTGTVTLVFLGRRRIRGIDPGRSMVARGRMTTFEDRTTIYNPAYELRPAGS